MNISVRQISSNALSILTSDVMSRATVFVLYALVARNLGAREFGQLSLALALFYTFQVFAMGGLKTLIIRQIAKDHSKTSAYFTNGCLLVAASSTTSILALWVFVRLMNYPPALSKPILLLGLGLLPYTLSAICEGIFQAWEQMLYIAYVNVPMNLAKIAAAFLFLWKGGGLHSVVLILLFSFTAVALIELAVVLLWFPVRGGCIDFSFLLKTARAAVTFLGIDGTLAIMSSLNLLFLSKLATETDVGLYNAGTQVLVPLMLVYQSLAQSVFPVMCRKVEPGFQTLKKIAEHAVELVLVLALPAVAGLFFLGGWVLSVLYKNTTFVEAFPALKLMACVLIFQGLTSVLGQVLVAVHRESITLRIVVVDSVFNLVVGWPLVAYLGLRGAALALLLTRLLDCIQHYIPVSRLFSGFSLAKMVWKPILAVACMAGYLEILQSRDVILTGLSATLIYVAAFLTLAIGACGGYRQFRDKYRPLLSQ